MSAHGTRAFLDKKKSGKTCSLGLLDDQTFLTLSFFLFFFSFNLKPQYTEEKEMQKNLSVQGQRGL